MNYVSPHHQVVVFDGPDALAFLQSQLTNDVAALAVGDWQWQGYCNAKGRLHATFALVRTAENAYAAVLHASVVPFVVKRLTMFRLRAKVAITVSESLCVVHHFDAPARSSSTLATLDLGNGRWVEITERTAVQPNDYSPEFIGRWNLIGIESKQPEIVSNTNEMFVPQMIGFDKLAPGPGVSFSKGCYPGQEVVARAHYRGAVKREPAVDALPDDATVEPGQEFTRADGTIVEIVNVARSDARQLALVVAPINASN
jgi:tRNA-modifying protein YgfZ